MLGVQQPSEAALINQFTGAGSSAKASVSLKAATFQQVTYCRRYTGRFRDLGSAGMIIPWKAATL